MIKDKSQEILSRIVGEKCQGTLVIEGGVLILYLGDVLQKMTKDTPLKTLWYFWIECGWRLYEEDKIVTGCYDDGEFICRYTPKLKDAVLIGVKYEETSHDLKLKFDNGMQIELFTDSAVNGQWRLRKANGYCYGIEENLFPHEWMEEPDK